MHSFVVLHYMNLEVIMRREKSQTERDKYCMISLTQAHLRVIVSLVPDHGNKGNITIKLVTCIFWFLRAYKSYVYTILWSIKCIKAFCLKETSIYTLINSLLLKNAIIQQYSVATKFQFAKIAIPMNCNKMNCVCM